MKSIVTIIVLLVSSIGWSKDAEFFVDPSAMVSVGVDIRSIVFRSADVPLVYGTLKGYLIDCTDNKKEGVKILGAGVIVSDEVGFVFSPVSFYSNRYSVGFDFGNRSSGISVGYILEF